MIKIFFLWVCIVNILNAQEIYFTQAEKAYMKENPTVKIGVHKNWMPISGVDEEGNYLGLMSEYVK